MRTAQDACVAALLEELVELHVLHGAEDLPDPTEPGEHDDRETALVRLDVVELP